VITANPYNQDIFVPERYHEAFQRYASTRKSGVEGIDASPFARMIDMWWASLCLGVRKGVRLPVGEQRTKIIDAAILGTDPWRITHVELLAIADAGEEVLDRPAEVVRIASEYAVAGMKDLIEEMLPYPEPMFPVCNYFKQVIEQA
jgi:hypothetical protein